MLWITDDCIFKVQYQKSIDIEFACFYTLDLNCEQNKMIIAHLTF